MRHAALIGALCAVCLTACSEETGPNISGVPDIDIIKVKVSPSLDTMFVADTLRTTDRLQMTASVIGRVGEIPNAKVAWASSDTGVATVTETGLVIPSGYGTTVISASASLVAKATIVVVPAARTVRIAPIMDTIFVEDPIAVRDSIRLRATALDQEGKPITGVAFTWASMGATTATVNIAGGVLARSVGVVNITASSGDQTGMATVRVASVVKAVQVSAPVTTVLAKDTVQLSAVALGYDDKPMGGRTFTWTSSNPAVATVDANGRAIFLRAGSATFTAKSAFTTSAVTIGALERQFQSIDAGRDVTCGYTNLGRGYCWGSGLLGRLASTADSTCFDEARPAASGATEPCTLAPKRFAGPAIEFTAVAVDSTSGCGISKQKQVYCWGDDSFGQIGNGQNGGGAQPRLATVAQVQFDSIAVGGMHACALSTTRQAYCWGRDLEGQLGDNRFVNSTTPIPVAGNLSFSSISAGIEHTCGIASAKVYCWGQNGSGQLGNGNVGSNADTPVAIASNASFVQVSAGANHTCALTTGGSAVCWGANLYGQTGPTAVGSVQPTPTNVGGGSFAQISAGYRHTCAITAEGAAYCWGSDDAEQTGGIGSASPAAVPGGLAFKSITAGQRHSCGLATDGETYCWGSNVFGALGNELQAAFRATPQKVASPR